MRFLLDREYGRAGVELGKVLRLPRAQLADQQRLRSLFGLRKGGLRRQGRLSKTVALIKILGRWRITDVFDRLQSAQVVCELKDLAAVDIGLHRYSQTPGALRLLERELLSGTFYLDLRQVCRREFEY